MKSSASVRDEADDNSAQFSTRVALVNSLVAAATLTMTSNVTLELSETQKLRDEEEPEPDTVRHTSDIIGEWGPLQWNVFIFHMLIYLVAPFQNIGIVFYAPKFDFWCKRPPGYENATLQTCNSYEDVTKPCKEWEYDMSFWRSTIVDEFDLVCDRAWLTTMAASIYQIGYGISSVVTARLSDTRGRLVAYKVSIIIEIVASLSQALAPNVYIFFAARLFLAIGALGRFMTGEILLLELVGPKHRGKLVAALSFGWGFGYMLLPGVNWAIRHFRYTQLLVFAYEMLFIVWLFRLPESPRWQLTHGQFDEAEKTIMKAALMKGKLNEEQIREKLLQLKSFVTKEDEKRRVEAKKSIFDLWKNPLMRRYCFVIYTIGFTGLFISYGFSYNSASLGGSLFVNVFLQGFADMISTVGKLFIIDRFPRKTLAVTSLFACALALFATIPFSFDDWGIPLQQFFITVGNICIGTAGTVRHLVIGEIFPTTLRQTVAGSSSLVSRFASTLAPFVKNLIEATHLTVVMAIFGMLATIVGFLFMLLPETRGKQLPDTIEESVNQYKKHKVDNSA